MATPREALRLLEVPGVARRLADCHHLDLVVAFGSAVDTGVEEPRDLDLAVQPTGSLDVLELLDDLYRLTGSEDGDLLDLRRAGPVARFEAMEGGVRLCEARETAGLRRAQLEGLAR